MTSASEHLRNFGLAWWNTNNYFHFRPEEANKNPKSRWPQSRSEYEEKCKRVDAALNELFKISGTPKVLALGEITSQAVHELRDRLLPDYRVLSLDVKKDDPTSQVAALYAPDTKLFTFEEQPPMVVPRKVSGTRPMAILDATIGNHTLRIIICHWQARMDQKGSSTTRDQMAFYLSGECYEFINKRLGKNHLAIIGDFNEEPFEGGFNTLNAHRHRSKSRGKPHYTDVEVKRVHLYNTAWRLLGEQLPHPDAELPANVLRNCAGTYYWEKERSWHHFDQLVVSGGLLGGNTPQLREDEVRIISTNAFLTEGLPLKFSRKDGQFIGLSDHLPIYANVHI
jgi:endonuclease/exonuclease/phosphatase family metal-dependent hydrolase